MCFQTQQKHFYSPEVPQNTECFLACDHLHEGKNQLTLINKSSFGLLLIPHLRNFFNRFSYSCKSITSHRQLLRGVLKKQIILTAFSLEQFKTITTDSHYTTFGLLTQSE